VWLRTLSDKPLGLLLGFIELIELAIDDAKINSSVWLVYPGSNAGWKKTVAYMEV